MPHKQGKFSVWYCNYQLLNPKEHSFYTKVGLVTPQLTVICSSGGPQHARPDKRPNNGGLNDTHRSHPKGKGGKKGGQKGKGSKKGQKGGKKGQKGGNKGKYAGTLAPFCAVRYLSLLATLVASEMAAFYRVHFCL